jgi:hypothetical protein
MPRAPQGYRPDVLVRIAYLTGDRGIHRGYCNICPITSPCGAWTSDSKDEIYAMAIEHMRLVHGIAEPTSGAV